MAEETFKAFAYLLSGCPFSFKYLLFMSEAGLLDQIQVVRCDPQDPEFERIKQRLREATGRDVTFPTVEVEPDRFLSDSDALIEYYARRHEVDVESLTALSFYKESIFPQLAALH